MILRRQLAKVLGKEGGLCDARRAANAERRTGWFMPGSAARRPISAPTQRRAGSAGPASAASLAGSKAGGGNPSRRSSKTNVGPLYTDEEVQAILAQAETQHHEHRIRAHLVSHDLASMLLRRELIERQYEEIDRVNVCLASQFAASMAQHVGRRQGARAAAPNQSGRPSVLVLRDDEVAELVLCTYLSCGVVPAKKDTRNAIFRSCPAWRVEAVRAFRAGGRCIEAGVQDRWHA